MDGASLSEEALQKVGGASSLGTVVDMLRKSPDAGISLHGGHFPVKGLVYQGL